MQSLRVSMHKVPAQQYASSSFVGSGAVGRIEFNRLPAPNQQSEKGNYFNKSAETSSQSAKAGLSEFQKGMLYAQLIGADNVDEELERRGVSRREWEETREKFESKPYQSMRNNNVRTDFVNESHGSDSNRFRMSKNIQISNSSPSPDHLLLSRLPTGPQPSRPPSHTYPGHTAAIQRVEGDSPAPSMHDASIFHQTADEGHMHQGLGGATLRSMMSTSNIHGALNETASSYNNQYNRFGKSGVHTQQLDQNQYSVHNMESKNQMNMSLNSSSPVPVNGVFEEEFLILREDIKRIEFFCKEVETFASTVQRKVTSNLDNVQSKMSEIDTRLSNGLSERFADLTRRISAQQNELGRMSMASDLVTNSMQPALMDLKNDLVNVSADVKVTSERLIALSSLVAGHKDENKEKDKGIEVSIIQLREKVDLLDKTLGDAMQKSITEAAVKVCTTQMDVLKTSVEAQIATVEAQLSDRINTRQVKGEDDKVMNLILDHKVTSAVSNLRAELNEDHAQFAGDTTAFVERNLVALEKKIMSCVEENGNKCISMAVSNCKDAVLIQDAETRKFVSDSMLEVVKNKADNKYVSDQMENLKGLFDTLKHDVFKEYSNLATANTTANSATEKTLSSTMAELDSRFLALTSRLETQTSLVASEFDEELKLKESHLKTSIQEIKEALSQINGPQLNSSFEKLQNRVDNFSGSIAEASSRAEVAHAISHQCQSLIRSLEISCASLTAKDSKEDTLSLIREEVEKRVETIWPVNAKNIIENVQNNLIESDEFLMLLGRCLNEGICEMVHTLVHELVSEDEERKKQNLFMEWETTQEEKRRKQELNIEESQDILVKKLLQLETMVGDFEIERRESNSIIERQSQALEELTRRLDTTEGLIARMEARMAESNSSLLHEMQLEVDSRKKLEDEQKSIQQQQQQQIFSLKSDMLQNSQKTYQQFGNHPVSIEKDKHTERLESQLQSLQQQILLMQQASIQQQNQQLSAANNVSMLLPPPSASNTLSNSVPATTTKNNSANNNNNNNNITNANTPPSPSRVRVHVHAIPPPSAPLFTGDVQPTPVTAHPRDPEKIRRVEWKIENLSDHRMRKPCGQSVWSPRFALGSLQGCKLQFFPNGSTAAGDGNYGSAELYLWLPMACELSAIIHIGSHVRSRIFVQPGERVCSFPAVIDLVELEKLDSVLVVVDQVVFGNSQQSTNNNILSGVENGSYQDYDASDIGAGGNGTSRAGSMSRRSGPFTAPPPKLP